MDEIGDEFDGESGSDKTEEELPELTNESDELDEFDDDIPETFSEPDEFDDDISETFSEPDEFDDDIPETFSEPDEFDDDIPETFSEPDEFDDDIPETFSEPDEFDDDIPETFSEPDEFDDDIPETFNETDEFDDDIPEVFGETDEIDDNLDDTIQNKENGERTNEDQDSGHVENVIENENIGSQSTSTVLTSGIEEIESNMEHQEEEEIEIRPEEYQGDMEPIVNTNESEFIKDVEELAEYARETKAEDENVDSQAEQENAAYYAEQYYESLKEKEVLNDQDSKEEQETEEFRQEVTEELNIDQESGYKTDELEGEDIIEASKEITSTEEFEYLWEIRDNLDQEGKTSEEIEEVMQEAEEMYETLKNAEKIIEELELEKLKLVDHEGEATEEDLKEDLDRVDLVEQAVELEEKLVQQGESQEEIDVRVEESIEATKFEEKLEIIIEELELEKLKLVDHEDEASEEDLKEDLDRVDLVEQAVELEEKLVQQGKLQGEIDVRVEESIEATKFEEGLEKIIEQQELKKLKLVDHEDEEEIDDAREEIDQPAEAEYYMETEEELHRQGMSQEEIDEQMEEIASNYQSEINEKQEKEEPKVNEELEKHDLETNEQNSSAEQCDQIELTSALSNEKKKESDEEEEENECLQDLYRQETGRRPMYARQKSKGYSKWLEQRELGAEKINISKSESEKKKEIDEEDWKTILKQWIKKASEEERNAEFISELKKALESYNKFEDLARKYLELYEKAQKENLSEKEKNRLKSLLGRLHERDPIQFELLLSVFFIKKYITEQYWDDFLNKPLVNRLLSKFFKQISKQIIKLRKAQENKENLEVLKLELDAIEIESEEKKDFLEEITKLGSDESDEEGWKTTLRQWIKEASEEECNAELKSELKKALECYNEFEALARKFMELYEKSQHEKLSEKEKNILKSLTGRLQELDPIKLELLTSVFFIKKYITEQYWYDFWNKPLVNRVLSKFFKHISQRILKLKELINSNEKLKLKKCQLIENQGDHSLDLVKKQNSLKNAKKKQNLGKGIHSYLDKEVKNIWKPLFEKLGNFKNVAKELNELYEKTERFIWPETVSNRIQKLFKNKKEYCIWHNKHAKQKIYSEDDVIKIWKPLFEKLGSYNAVKRELSKNYHGIPPRIETIISKLQKLFKDHPEHFEEKTHFKWFLKYTKQYHDDVVKNWINLFEEFGSYRLVRHYLKSQNVRIPSESTIRRRVKIYFEKNKLDYFNWINQYESASHYYSNEILIWKHLFEEIGTYRGVALRFEQIDGRLPSHKNIKLRLKKSFLSEQQDFKEYSFEEWEGKFGRYFHINPVIERWIDLFKRYGSFYSVYKIEKSNPNIYYKLPTSVETIIKQVQNYLKDDFDTFYKNFHNPTPIPLIREKIINDLHKNPPKSLESIATMLNTTRKTVTKYAHEEYDPIKYEERWYNEIPQSIEQPIIEDILNSQLTLRRIAEKWDVSRTPITRLAKKVCPNFRERFPLIGYLLLGTLFHLCFNSILTDFFTSKRIKYFSEVPIFPPSWKRADGFLFNDNEYVNNLILNFGLKNIMGVQFEFTFDLSEENLLEKIQKYQHPNILLLIIGTNWDYSGEYHLKLKNANILYPQNIKIINPLNFAKIIQLKDRFQDRFRELLEFNNIKNLDNLKSIVDLDIIETNRMDELEEYLKKLGYSIESFFGISSKTKLKTLDDFNFFRR